MHMTKGWSGLRTAVIALSLFAWTTTGVKASPVTNLLDYSTALGFVGPAGISTTNNGVPESMPTNVISFNAVSASQIDPNSNIPLGSFQVSPLPTGVTTTYTNTPFQINFIPISYAGMDVPGGSSIMLTGTLNGTITGSSASSVIASFNQTASGTFSLSGMPSSLDVLQTNQFLVPSSAGATSNTPGGITTLQGTIVTNVSLNPETPAPEPSTIALFLSTIGGLGLRRYVLSRRRENRA
ncbi:MAG: PEP-CTERM sorting domain-containing protein [Isosphaeraceae bacterium]